MKVSRLFNIAFRCVAHPRTLLQAFRVLRDRRIVEQSAFFDREWYAFQCNLTEDYDPATAYIVDDWGGQNPSRNFIGAEYTEIHGINPLLISPLAHYERYGKKHGYVISYRDLAANGGKRTGCTSHANFSFETLESDRQRKLKEIQSRILARGCIKVKFFVFNASIFQSRPVFEAMVADELFDPEIVVIPDFSDRTKTESAMETCYADLSATFGNRRVTKASKAKDGKWMDYLDDADFVFYSTPYTLSDMRYNPGWDLNKSVLSLYANYSYNVTQYGIGYYRHEVFANFWRVLLESESALQEFSRLSASHGSNASVTGYFKMDDLALHASDNYAKKRKRVIIAPHHSFKGGFNDSLAISNFLEYSELFAALPGMYPDIDFVFRPHPYLRAALENAAQWGKKRTDAYFQKMSSWKNASISTGEYMGEFAKSDGLIQDCGSFLAEYFYTGKPQCYMLKPNDDPKRAFTPFGQECIKYCYKAYKESDIIKFIEDVIIGGNDPMKPERDAFANTKVMVNHPRAAQAAINMLKSKILKPVMQD